MKKNTSTKLYATPWPDREDAEFVLLNSTHCTNGIGNIYGKVVQLNARNCHEHWDCEFKLPAYFFYGDIKTLEETLIE